MAAPVGNIYTGALASSASAISAVFGVARNSAVAICVYSLYAATAGTTGIDVLAAYSIDGGLSYSDYVSLGIVTAPSGTTPSQTQKTILQDGSYATHIKFKITNKDATNGATDVEVLATSVAHR